ncbi:MAG: hypothetical protein HKN31_07810 [Pricia sp.]|nr:hypothetical protein [Pricia sp.]
MKLLILLVVVFIVCGIACDGNRQPKSAALTLHGGDSKILANLNTYVDSCWNKHDTTFLSQIATERFVRNLNGIPVASSKREMQAHMSVFFKAFPDLKLSLGKAYTLDNTIFLHWSSVGTHTGTFGEAIATGKKVNINGLAQLYFDEDGNLSGEDVVFNELDLLQQLGFTLNLPVSE